MGGLFMEQREKINTKEILRASQMGMWCVEMEEGKPPRFYADEVMDELLGIDRDITPEERFVFHRSRITSGRHAAVSGVFG